MWRWVVVLAVVVLSAVAARRQQHLYYIRDASPEAVAAMATYADPAEFALIELHEGALLARSAVPPRKLFGDELLAAASVEHVHQAERRLGGFRHRPPKRRPGWRLGGERHSSHASDVRVLLFDDALPLPLPEDCEARGHGARGVLVECKETRPDRLLLLLEQQPNVRHAERWEPPRAKDSYANWVLQSNVEQWTPLWDAGLDGSGQLLGVGDGGMQQRFCQLADVGCGPSVAGNPPVCRAGGGDYYSPPCAQCVSYCLDPDDVNCRPADNGHPIVRAFRPFADFSDYDGHGTATTSLAVGRAPPGASADPDTEAQRGVAHGARLLFTDIGPGSSPYYDIPVPLDTAYYPWAYGLGARVHSDSWGSSSDGSYSSLTQDIDAFCWYHRKFLPVFAAGNEGDQYGLSSCTTQSSAKNALSVGATMHAYNATVRFHSFSAAYNVRAYPSRFTQDWVAPFSSFGPTQDGRIKPDVVAPGVTVTVANAARSALSGAAEPECSYAEIFQGEAGTSFSTPLVASSLLLLRQWLAQGGYRGAPHPDPDASLIKAMVIHSAVATLGINVYDRGYVLSAEALEADAALAPFGYRYIQGFGRVNLVNYTDSASERLYLSGVEQQSLPTFTGNGQQVDLCAVATGNDTLTATLVWTDFPASLRAASQLVNDLDLIVFDAGCRRYYPNGLRDRADGINNVERVERVPIGPAAAPVVLRVRAARISVGPQDFSLVASVGNVRLEVGPCQTTVACDSRTTLKEVGSGEAPAVVASTAAASSPRLLFLVVLLLLFFVL